MWRRRRLGFWGNWPQSCHKLIDVAARIAVQFVSQIIVVLLRIAENAAHKVIILRLVSVVQFPNLCFMRGNPIEMLESVIYRERFNAFVDCICCRPFEQFRCGIAEFTNGLINGWM